MTNPEQQNNNQSQTQALYEAYEERYSNLLENVKKQSSSMLSVDKEAYSVAVTGDFGTGKTTFLKGLEDYINEKAKENCKAVYIDAQRFDCPDSPHEILATLLEHLALFYESNSKKIINAIVFALRNIAPDKYKKIMRHTMKVFNSVYKKKKSFFANLDKLLYGESMAEFHRSFSEEAVKFNISVQMLEKIELEVIQKWKRLISEDNFSLSVQMLEKLAQESIPNSEKKFILIIDELDKTSPAYSLKFLETVRHLLPVNNIIFIFGINYNQMRSMVKSQYGIEDTVAATYFAKYFKHTYDLEVWQKTDLLKFHEKKFKYFFDTLIFKNTFPTKPGEGFLRYSYIMCVLFNLSLREMRDVVILLRENLVKFLDEYDFDNSRLYNFIVVMFLLCIKTKNPNLLEKIIQNGGEVDELLRYFLLLFEKAPKQLFSEYSRKKHSGEYMSPEILAIVEIIVYACDQFQGKKTLEIFYITIQNICDDQKLSYKGAKVNKKVGNEQDNENKIVNNSKQLIPSRFNWFFYKQLDKTEKYPNSDQFTLKDLAIIVHS